MISNKQRVLVAGAAGTHRARASDDRTTMPLRARWRTVYAVAHRVGIHTHTCMCNAERKRERERGKGRSSSRRFLLRLPMVIAPSAEPPLYRAVLRLPTSPPLGAKREREREWERERNGGISISDYGVNARGRLRSGCDFFRGSIWGNWKIEVQVYRKRREMGGYFGCILV